MQDDIVHFEVNGKVVVAAVRNTPRLDQSNCDLFGAALMRYLESHTGAHMLVSLEGIAYISSSVLSELIQALRKASKDGGSVRVCSVTEYVESVFEVTQLASTFRLCHALDEALAQFHADLDAVNA